MPLIPIRHCDFTAPIYGPIKAKLSNQNIVMQLPVVITKIQRVTSH